MTNIKTSELRNEATTVKHVRVTPISKIRKPARSLLRTTGCRKLNKQYSVGVSSNGRKFMANLWKISEVVEKLLRLTPRETDRQTDKGAFIYTHRNVMSKARSQFVLAQNAG